MIDAPAIGNTLLQLDYVAVDAVVPYVRNPRKHPEKEVAGLAAFIKRVGFRVPILLDGNREIIAGHGRVLAAKRLGLKQVPFIDCSDLAPADVRALRVADNRFAELAEWDDGLLAGELAAIDAGLAKLTGFTDKEVEKLLAEASRAANGGGGEGHGLTDPDATPELLTQAVSAAGDIWLLGKHRVVCGDATDAELVAALLAGAEPHLMITDPPYGVEYDPAWRAEANANGTLRRRSGTVRSFNATGAVHNDDRADWAAAWRLFEGDVAYVWCASLYSPEAIVSLETAGFERCSQIIWNKPHFAISRGHYHWQHEPCWYVVRKGAAGHWAGDRKQTTVWDITSAVGFTSQTDGPNARTGHGTQKPVECMRRPMLNNSKPGDLVYDPFLGSGTSVIAAEMCGRVCLGCELDPAYVDIIVRRWQDFTGRKAVLEGDGRSFEATGVERGALLAI